MGIFWLATLVGLALGGSAFVSSTVSTLITLAAETELFLELTLELELELEEEELDADLGRLSALSTDSSLIDGASL